MYPFYKIEEVSQIKKRLAYRKVKRKMIKFFLIFLGLFFCNLFVWELSIWWVFLPITIGSFGIVIFDLFELHYL